MSEPQKIRVQSFAKKYADSICKSIEASSCKMLEAFSLFNIDLIPLCSTNSFKIYGNEEVLTLATLFFPGTDVNLVKLQWKDFK